MFCPFSRNKYLAVRCYSMQKMVGGWFKAGKRVDWIVYIQFVLRVGVHKTPEVTAENNR